MAGYLGASPAPQAVQRKQTFTATASQTTFTTTGYTDGAFINVYLNGVRLINGTDYTATNGSDIVLTTGASANDVLDFETLNEVTLVNGTIEFNDGTESAPSITNYGDTNTGIYFPGADKIGFVEGGSEVARIAGNDFLINKTYNDLTVEGQEFRNDNQVGFTRSGGNPLAVRRNTNDGGVISVSSATGKVGEIGCVFGDLNIYSTDSGHKGIRFASSGLLPTDNTGSLEDDASDMGSSTYKFNDLYLGGGVYLGGTGAVNKLDDYEEGTYTVTIGTSISGSVTLNSSWQYGSYVKVGNIVHAQGAVDQASASSPTGYFTISLPFTAKSDSPTQAYRASASVTVYNTVSANMADFVPLLVDGESSLRVYLGDGTALQVDSAQQLNNGASPRIAFQITYRAT